MLQIVLFSRVLLVFSGELLPETLNLEMFTMADKVTVTSKYSKTCMITSDNATSQKLNARYHGLKRDM